jgi:hypothetical protein
MMNNWIKISGDTYYVRECDVQLSMESWATIYLVLDLASYPSYYDDFVDLYEKRSVFSISTKKFAAAGCRIKSIDIDFGQKISASIRCENIDTHDMSVRRGQIIDDILGDETTFIRMAV